jgi:hypothetical protein
LVEWGERGMGTSSSSSSLWIAMDSSLYRAAA